jgi:hypothetical protein
VDEKNMRQRRIIRTTLGDLIVAVTEEVMPIVRDPADAYVLVSWILNDLLTHHRVPDHKQSRLKYQTNSKWDENVKEIGHERGFHTVWRGERNGCAHPRKAGG